MTTRQDFPEDLMIKAFAAAFEKWEREFREDPGAYMTREQIAAADEATLAEKR